MSARPTKGRPATPTKGPRKSEYTDKGNAKPKPKRKRKTKAKASSSAPRKTKRKTKAKAAPRRKAKTKRKVTTKAKGKTGRGGTYRTLTKKKRETYLANRAKGSTKTQSAAAADIPRSTLYGALKRDRAFAIADTEATDAGVHEIVDALFAKAKGKGPGSVVAAIFWLKNRASDNWSDVKEVHVIEKLMREERAKLSTALEAAGLTDQQLAKIDAILNGTDPADATVH